jgi:branched-chain amino acid transport system ATP-binding protein
MQTPYQQHALVLTAVSKSFGGVHAVRAVDLVVPSGERRALIGPNGAGKTTLFNLIAGELQVDSGRIEMFAAEITRKSVQQRARLGLGRTYQISQLFLNLSVEENLFLAGAARNGLESHLLKYWRDFGNEREWARQVAGQVELTPYLGAKVSEISHGLQRQLEVGMAIAMRPRLIMLDEPAAGLSTSERASLTRLIKALPRQVTLILIEHDMEIVLDLADRITVLHNGSVIAEGAPSEIQASQEVQDVYLGSSYASHTPHDA